MTGSSESSTQREIGRLVDENEQLRASLEAALEEHALVLEERDRHRHRNEHLTGELQVLQSRLKESEDRADRAEMSELRQEQAEETLRVAFEELQVLTEELEVANSGLLKTNVELDARVEERTWQLRDINHDLRTTEASLRTMADLVPELLWRTDAKGQPDWFNRRWLEYAGRSVEEWVGSGWLEALHAGDREVAHTAWMQAVAMGASFERECRICDKRGAPRWFLIRAEPLLDPKAQAVRWFFAATDIQAYRLAMASLERSELRFRTLIEGMPQLVWRAEDGGVWTWCSPQWCDYTGQDEMAARGEGWMDAFHPDDREAARAAWRRATESGELEIEGRIFHAPESRHRHFRTRARAVRDPSGKVVEWLGTSTDVDDIVQLREEQGVLVAELQHRTRNLMGVIRSMADKTARTSHGFEDFRLRYRDRLDAMARVQGLLSRLNDTDRVAFDELIETEIAAMHDGSDRVSLQGPKGVRLRSSTVQTLAMALHELATNAVKYGALGQPQGRLAIAWSFEPSGAEGKPWLNIDWRESGVAMPAQDTIAWGSGQGRELIERALPYQLRAHTTYELGPDGVHCTISIPVSDTSGALEATNG